MKSGGIRLEFALQGGCDLSDHLQNGRVSGRGRTKVLAEYSAATSLKRP